ncbi:MAG: hypothetical protein IH991_18840 [Planctomycetes bacterium]|nr:hypothetical protein [Planctomycetota bacterium]
MRAAALMLVFAVLSSPLFAGDIAIRKPAKVGSYVLVTEGIVGGFAPAHVRQRIIVVSQNGKHELLVFKQPQRNSPKTFLRGTLTDMQMDALRKDLAKNGLWSLPTEKPAGCQDIYKSDTSIAVRDGDKFWRNGGPGGCVRGVSKVQPTEKQIGQFKAVLAVVKKAAQQAKEKGDEKSFTATLRLLMRDGVNLKKAPPVKTRTEIRFGT